MKYGVAFLLPMVFVLLTRPWLDNDSWFVLAEGRYIVNNGVYFTDVLSMHEGLNIVVQQYGFAVIFWLVYSVAGPIGLYVSMLVLNFLVCFLIYKICMLISKGNVDLSLLIMVITDFFLAINQFLVTRAQVVSYAIFLVLIFLLELYIERKNRKYLYPIPILSLVQINLHASLWPMILLVLGVYIIDSFKVPKLHLQGYNTKPLIIILIISFIVGILNPYGIKMMTFILTSYGIDTIFSMVGEMTAFNLRNRFNILTYMAIVFVILAYIFGKRKNIRIRYLLMFFGFLALGINSIKGLSQLFLVMFIPLALLFKDVRFEKGGKKIEKIKKAVIGWGGVMTVVSAAILMVGVLGRLDDMPDKISREGVDKIDESVEMRGESKEELRIYTGYDDGGYLEFRGYKPYLDPRAEVFIKKNNEKEDILDEWVDCRLGRIDKGEFLEKYDFDYLFVRGEQDPLYKLEDEKYEKIYEDKSMETEVYRRVVEERSEG